MSFTYDPTTDFGKVRLLAQDFDSSNAVFQDNEIQAFLDLNSANVRLAAAQALEVIAANEAFIAKKSTIDGDSFDGPAVATALKGMAAEYRRQVMDADADGAGLFDWAEDVVDTFTLRERLLNELLRNSA